MVGRSQTAYHKLSTSDLQETGEVLDFVCGGQLTTCGYAESHEALVHDGCASLARLKIWTVVVDLRFRSARAA
jgi:hypothetical protein